MSVSSLVVVTRGFKCVLVPKIKLGAESCSVVTMCTEC